MSYFLLFFLSFFNTFNSQFLTGSATYGTPSISLNVDINTTKALITFSGPQYQWFAVAFNGQLMTDNSWGIASDGTGQFSEIKLKGRTIPDVLTTNTQCQLISSILLNSRYTLTITCNLMGQYTFPTTTSTINMLYGLSTIGTSSNSQSLFANKHEVKGSSTLFISTPEPTRNPLCCNNTYEPTLIPSKEPTNEPTITTTGTGSSPTNNGISVCGGPSFGLPLTKLSSTNLMKVGIIVDCQLSTVNVTMQGPSNNQWFGIVFGTEMASTAGNLAIVYTTSNGNAGKCGSYIITLKTGAGVNPYTFNWDTLSNTVVNGNRVLECSMPLSRTNGLFTLTTNDVSFSYAIGSMLGIGFHDVAYGRRTEFQLFKLKEGGVSTIAAKADPLHIIHGICMWLAWSFFSTIGIFMSKNRHLIASKGPLWFFLHKTFQMCCIIFQLIGLIIMMIAKRQDGLPITPQPNFHEITGFIIIILGVLQPVNAMFRGTHEDQEKRTPRRVIWEYVHKSIGYLCLIIGQFVGAAGLRLIGAKTGLFIVHIIYVCLWFIAFIGLHFIGRNGETKETHKETANSVEMDTNEVR